jgi:2-iminobutanoate/2-iminopropanoate deaminase
MLHLETLGIEEAQRAIEAVVEAASLEGKPMSVAVVDDHGELIACTRMNGSHARVLKHAIRKAYTAAVMGRDTLTFKFDLWERNGNLDEWGDSTLTTLQGGLVAMCDGRIVGAVGVGGNSTARDEEVARVGLRAMGVTPTKEKPMFIEADQAPSVSRQSERPRNAPTEGVTKPVATTRRSLHVSGAPAGAMAPAGARFGDYVFSSTITGTDPRTGQLGEGPDQQLEFAYQNLQALIDSAGITSDNVAHVTNFIRDQSLRPYLNKPWLAMFPDENNRPARKTTQFELPGNQLIQIQMLAIAGATRQRLEIPGLAHRDPLPMGVKIGNMVYSSVIGGQDPRTGKNVDGAEPQIDMCFEDMQRLIEIAGGSANDILHHWVFMRDFTYQPYMVDVYLRHFPEFGNRPARKTVRYDLGGDTEIQQQFIAVLGGKRENFEIPGVSHHDPIPMAARIGNLAMSSGMSGDDPKTGKVPEGVEAQAEGSFANMQRMVEIVGGTTANIAHVTILVKEYSSIPTIEKYWQQMFPDAGNRPAMHLMKLGLQGSGQVQLHMTAVL